MRDEDGEGDADGDGNGDGDAVLADCCPNNSGVMKERKKETRGKEQGARNKEQRTKHAERSFVAKRR